MQWNKIVVTEFWEILLAGNVKGILEAVWQDEKFCCCCCGVTAGA